MELEVNIKSWRPERTVSMGASEFYDAVVDASWNNNNIIELINLIKQKIEKDNVVADFGAGTGSSSMRLLESVNFDFKLQLVDNSASWLGKAYSVLHTNDKCEFFLLEKKDEEYRTLDKTIGSGVADIVMSANTFHLVSDLKSTFAGIHKSLKQGGTFAFNSGNVLREGREHGLLMIDDTVALVHDMAIDIINTDDKYSAYRKDLDTRISSNVDQRKAIFPDPRPLEYYLESLEQVGFRCEKPQYKSIKVLYEDWLTLLKVNRLGSGILPEVGGKEPSSAERKDRDELITLASKQLFKKLETENQFADETGFTGEWIYITAVKI